MRRFAVVALVAALAGCASAPPPATEVKPVVRAEPRAEPRIEAGDYAEILTEIKQAVTQIQTTISTVTTNYALDAERAKLERAKDRDARVRAAGDTAIWLGLAILMFVMPEPPMGRWRAAVLGLGLALIAGGGLAPLLWAF